MADNVPEGVPVVVVLYSAGPLIVRNILDHPKIGAVLHHVYPGQSGGDAIAQVLAGASNPAGRLACTWPTSVHDLPPITNYSMLARTYRYAAVPPALPFGYGLSFTSFSYSNLALGNATLAVCTPLTLSVDVTNIGPVPGDEVVQVSLPMPSCSLPMPSCMVLTRAHCPGVRVVGGPGGGPGHARAAAGCLHPGVDQAHAVSLPALHCHPCSAGRLHVRLCLSFYSFLLYYLGFYPCTLLSNCSC